MAAEHGHPGQQSGKGVAHPSLRAGRDQNLTLSQPSVNDSEPRFCSSEWLSIFETFADHTLVKPLIRACALIAGADDWQEKSKIDVARTLHVHGLGAVRAATLNARTVREDATLVASILLASLEVSRYVCEIISA